MACSGGALLVPTGAAPIQPPQQTSHATNGSRSTRQAGAAPGTGSGGEEVGGRRDQARPVVADVADERGDRMQSDPVGGTGVQQLVKYGRRRQRVEPRGEV